MLEQADELRRPIPFVALATAIVAAVADPAGWVDCALGAVPVAAFAVWAWRPRVPLSLLTVAVLVPVVVAQRDGGLEPLLFEASLLAFVLARWAGSLVWAVALGIAALLAPIAAALLQDPPEIASGTWLLGIAFPWVMGRALARQEQLVVELEATQNELAQQALFAERRRIARDVHDFVGHGLAAVMLQLTSARHVLRRDPDAAEEALRSAEEVGRRSMHELRRTVALLRSDDEAGVEAPLPTAREVATLVDHARAGGLAAELRVRGDLSPIDPAVGLAAYRIAQEALANASRHAPHARTVLELETSAEHVRLTATTTGPVLAEPPSESQRARYGVIGMRERATALGGKLDAGPTPDGWRVDCRLPLVAKEPARA